MESESFHKRVFFRLVAAPVATVPFVLGTLLLAGAWSLGQGTSWLAIAGISGMVLGSGIAFSRLLFSVDDITRQIQKEDLQAGHENERDQLDWLSQRVARGGLPETARQLLHMRRLNERLKELSTANSRTEREIYRDIRDTAEQLYRSTLATLARAVDMNEAARRLSTPGGREQLAASQRKLTEEIESSIQQLGRSLDFVQTAVLDANNGDENLADIRRELAIGLEVAQKVEERVSAWRESTSGNRQRE